jgi:hypothetical protein
MSPGARLQLQLSEKDLWKFTLGVFIASFAILALGLLVISTFSFDSWSVYELSQTPGDRFFEANTSRAYYGADSLYSTAFAPLWPIVIALFTPITENIYGSYIASFVCFAGFAIAAEELGRRAFNRRGLGLLSALLLLRFAGMRSELGAGRSIPLFLFELACVGCLFFRMERASARRVFAIGGLAGMMVMTRFDAIPSALVVLVGVVILGVRDRRYLLVLLGFFLAISPWIVYSWAHFHTLFATDNRVVALSVDPNTFVMDYHLRPTRTLADAPLAWMGKIFAHVPPFLGAFGMSFLLSIFGPVVLAIALISAYRFEGRRPPRQWDQRHRGLLLLALVGIAPLAGYLVTGYTEQRYFSATIWIADFLALGYVSRTVWRYPVVAFWLVVLGGVASLAVLRRSVKSDPVANMRKELDHKDIDALVGCLTRAGAGRSDAVLFREALPVNPVKFGALTRWRTLTLPSNWVKLDDASRTAFLKAYRAQYVVGSVAPSEAVLTSGATEISCPVPLRQIAAPDF